MSAGLPRVLAPGSPDVEVTLVLALELLAMVASVLVHRWFPAGLAAALAAGARALDPRRVATVVGVSVAAIYLLVSLTTPQIDFGTGALGSGYGDDGAIYGYMTEHFAWFTQRGAGPHYYRILAPALVHYSGLGTFAGFHLLNAVSFVFAAALMYVTARRLGFSRPGALLAFYFFALLKFGVKFWRYYPVLTDGLGTLLMMTIIYATVSRKSALYVLGTTAAVFCRENLLALVVFNVLHELRRDGWRVRRPAVALLHGVPIVVFLLSREFPVFPPLAPSAAAPFILDFAWRFVSQPARQAVVLMSYVNSLGVVALLAVVRWRRVARFLVGRAEWLYYFVTTLVMSIVLGTDVDRYAVWLAPVLILAVLDPEPPLDAASVRRAACLVLLHAAAMELYLPWYPDRGFYLGLTAAHASSPAYAAMTAATVALAACAAALLRRRGIATIAS